MGVQLGAIHTMTLVGLKKMFLGEILCPELIPKLTLLKNLDVQLTVLKTYLVKGERAWGHNPSFSSPFCFSKIPVLY